MAIAQAAGFWNLRLCIQKVPSSLRLRAARIAGRIQTVFCAGLNNLCWMTNKDCSSILVKTDFSCSWVQDEFPKMCDGEWLIHSIKSNILWFFRQADSTVTSEKCGNYGGMLKCVQLMVSICFLAQRYTIYTNYISFNWTFFLYAVLLWAVT